MADCVICYSSYTKILRKAVTCKFCNKSACAICQKRYILSSHEDPHCMHCKILWDREFLTENLSKSFIIGDLRKHREQILFDREQSLLPATFPYVEIRKQILGFLAESAENIKNLNKICDTSDYTKFMEDVSKKNASLREVRVTFMNSKRRPADAQTYYDKIKEIHANYDKNNKITHKGIIDIISANSKEKRAIHRKIRRYEGAYNSQNPDEFLNTDSKDQKIERRKFIRGCPTNGCKGFLNSQWHCSLCECWVCPECNDTKAAQDDPLHECKQENIESAKLIAKDTRPCPNCAAQIFKIIGCDQMFCTACNTPFSWLKGTIITSGQVHNPHYFEWMKNNKPGGVGRTAGDIPCGDVPHGNIFWEAYDKFKDDKLYDSLPEIFRIITHIRYVILDRLPTQNLLPEDNKENRVNYMLNNINIETFKQRIQQSEKKREKNLALRLIYEMAITASCDILRGLLDDTTRKMRTSKEWMDDLEGLRQYICDCLKKVAYTYNSGVQLIKEESLYGQKSWRIDYYKIETKKRKIQGDPSTAAETNQQTNEFVPADLDAAADADADADI